MRLASSIVALIACASVSAERLAAADPSESCRPAVRAWAAKCGGAIGRDVSELRCPVGRAIVSVSVEGAPALVVEITADGAHAFRRAGALGLAPVGDFPDWNAAPAAAQAAFAAIATCIERDATVIASSAGSTIAPTASTAPDDGMTLASLAAEAMIFAQLASLVVLLPLFALFVVRRARVHPAELIITAGLLVVALALRWWLPVHTLVHENRHGYQFGPGMRLTAAVFEHGVASSHLTLGWIAGRLLPVGDQAILAIDVGLSAISVAAIYNLARLAIGSRLAGWSAACLLLLQPLAILMAPTEEYLVSSTGLVLSGMALLWLGGREGGALPLVLGAVLTCLGASAREITAPLAALGVFALIAGTEPGRPLPWRRLLATVAFMSAMLAPRAINILSALHSRGVPHFMGAPTLPLARPHIAGGPPLVTTSWIGWHAPYVPSWMAWVGLVAAPALLIAAWIRRDARLPLVTVGSFVLASAAAGLVAAGWFPSMLRHQVAAMALFLLPIAWAVDALARLVGRAVARRGEGTGLADRSVRVALACLVPIVGAVTLAVRPAGFRLDAPEVREYLFLRDTLRALPDDASALYFNDPSVPVLPPEWFAQLHPKWGLFPSEELATIEPSAAAPAPLYLVLDRACFMNERCISDPTTCESPEARAALKLTPSPYGHLRAICARALEAATWSEVAHLDIPTMTPPRFQSFDLPPADDRTRLAVLRWQGPPALPGAQPVAPVAQPSAPPER